LDVGGKHVQTFLSSGCFCHDAWHFCIINLLPLKILIQTLLFSTFLSAQQNDAWTMIQFGLGFRTANGGPSTKNGGSGTLGDMTNQAQSIGVIAESKMLFANFRMAIRIKGAFDRWGKQHFKGTANDRCEVECLSGTLGFMLYPDGLKYSGVNIVICIELGAAQWGIDSSYPSWVT
jgi:hypothetical protein